jgi:uncharacterized protein
LKPVFVDTNLFLRYLTNDIPDQADRVESLLKKASEGEVALATSSLVIAELVWTMESFYRLSRDRIRRSIFAILNTRGLEVEHHELVLQAIVWYEEKNIDYADAYNAAWLFARGMSCVFTFDRRHFARIEGLELGGF